MFGSMRRIGCGFSSVSRVISGYRRFGIGIRFRGYSSDYTIGQGNIRAAEDEKERKDEEDAEKDGLDPTYKKNSLYGVDKDSAENKGVDLNKVLKRVETLEKAAKFYVYSRGIPLIEPFDRPDSFFYKDIGTRVLTPEIRESYEKDDIKNKKIIEERYEEFRETSFDAIEKLLELRQRHWGKSHPLTLSTTLIQLSMLEVAKEEEKLYDQCIMWLLRVDKWLQEVSSTLEEIPTIQRNEDKIRYDIYKADFQMILNFYACLIRLMTDAMIRKGDIQDAIDLAKVALESLSKYQEDNVVNIILISRNLANGYIESGKPENAISVMETVLELQSDTHLTQKISKTFSVNEWIDPVIERLNTTQQLAKLKFSAAQYDEAEALFRIALNLAIEHSGKYTTLACGIQYDILCLIKEDPRKTDKNFIDLFMLTLDIAKETHKRIKQDIDSTGDLLTKKSLASSMPYTTLLKFGLDMFAYSKNHLNLHTQLLLDATVAMTEEQVSGNDFEYCQFIFYAVDTFMKRGKYQYAVDTLHISSQIMIETFLDPAYPLAYYMELQAKAQLLLDFKGAAKSLPFVDFSLTKRNPHHKSLEISYDLIQDALNMVKRTNNNQLEPCYSASLLYTLSTVQVMHDKIEDAEKNLARCLTLLGPITESETSLNGNPMKLDPKGLETLANSVILSATIFKETKRIERAMKYFQYACKVLVVSREKAINSENPIVLNEDDIKRFRCIEKCINNLLALQSPITKSNPTKENQALLEYYEDHLVKIQQRKQKLKENHQRYTDIFLGSTFKSGPDLSAIEKQMELEQQSESDEMKKE